MWSGWKETKEDSESVDIETGISVQAMSAIDNRRKQEAASWEAVERDHPTR